MTANLEICNKCPRFNYGTNGYISVYPYKDSIYCVKLTNAGYTLAWEVLDEDGVSLEEFNKRTVPDCCPFKLEQLLSNDFGVVTADESFFDSEPLSEIIHG